MDTTPGECVRSSSVVMQVRHAVVEPPLDKGPASFLQVCGLKWSYDDRELASGGNDNQLCVWNTSSTSPVLKYGDHKAAVKAIAWSPHQHGLLASGGGTADRCIRFWNTATNTALSCLDTGSQVRAWK
jgi:WD40 repeat protein